MITIDDLSMKGNLALEVKKRADKHYNQETKPILEDISQIGDLYKWFLGQDRLVDEQSVNSRLFTLIITALYYPAYFSNKRLKKNGLRGELSRVLNLDPRAISAHLSSAYYWYKTYPKFKAKTDTLLKTMLKEKLG